jgi:hypothetical protein
MRRLPLAALALSLATLTAPAASADPNYHYFGGCGLTVMNDTTGQLGGRTQWNGVVDIRAVALGANVSLPAPVSIDVECHLYVNGVWVGMILDAHGFGVALNAAPLSFSADLGSVVTLCAEIVVGGEIEPEDCVDAATTQMIPQFVDDVVTAVLTTFVDPTACAILSQLAPGIPGVVDINSEGDVTVLGSIMVTDCPPYAEPQQPRIDGPYLMTARTW